MPPPLGIRRPIARRLPPQRFPPGPVASARSSLKGKVMQISHSRETESQGIGRNLDSMRILVIEDGHIAEQGTHADREWRGWPGHGP